MAGTRSILSVLKESQWEYGNVEQDPAAFGGAIINSTKKALEVPYLYTLLARHEKWGETVARPLWNVFPTDINVSKIDRQFLWGSGILITPVLDENQTTVRSYFPNSRFYDYYTGQEVPVRGNYTILNAPLDHINVHVHGGNIIPTQEPAVNTDISRNNPFGLIVALNDKAAGSFNCDDGVSFDPIQTGEYFLARMTAGNKTVTYEAHMDHYPGMATKIINKVRLRVS